MIHLGASGPSQGCTWGASWSGNLLKPWLGWICFPRLTNMAVGSPQIFAGCWMETALCHNLGKKQSWHSSQHGSWLLWEWGRERVPKTEIIDFFIILSCKWHPITFAILYLLQGVSSPAHTLVMQRSIIGGHGHKEVGITGDHIRGCPSYPVFHCYMHSLQLEWAEGEETGKVLKSKTTDGLNVFLAVTFDIVSHTTWCLHLIIVGHWHLFIHLGIYDM